jgi:hypothetical protein
MDAPERRKGGIVEAGAHADTEQQPGEHKHGDRGGEAEQRESRRQHQIGHRQHGPAADEIDLAADAWADQRGEYQRCREGAEHPVRGYPEIARDRIGEDCGHVIARSPGQRLGRAERQNDRKRPAHGLFAIVFVAGVIRTRFASSFFIQCHRIGRIRG